MEIGYYRDDWMILNCDTCMGNVCRECCDIDDDTGTVVCTDCLQTKAMRTRE